MKKIISLLSSIVFTLLPSSALSADSTNDGQHNYPFLNLGEIQPHSQTVLVGNVLSEPLHTADGYIAPIEGRLLLIFDEEGKVAWQHKMSTKAGTLSLGKGGMIFCLSRNTVLSMVNPSGIELWKANLGFKALDKPLTGRDGRIFVRGENEVACYGLQGVRRWKELVPNQNADIPLTELNDGRLIVFLSKTEGGKTTAYTISPFGELEEEIVFGGIVASAVPCEDGVLLSFTDGSIGLCSVKSGKTSSTWIIHAKDSGFNSSAEIIPNAFHNDTAAFISHSRIVFVNTRNGEMLNSFGCSVNTSMIAFKSMTSQGLVLADKQTAECYGLDGNLVWKATLPKTPEWNYLFITDEGYLVFCRSDWVVASYRIMQNITKTKPPVPEKTPSQYASLYSKSATASTPLLGGSLSSQTLADIEKAWKKGDFGKQEKEWLSLLTADLSSLQNMWNTEANRRYMAETSFFKNNEAYTQQILDLASQSGLCAFQGLFASLLYQTEDPSMQFRLVRSMGSTAYDFDGKMLAALEYIIHHVDPAAGERILMAVCDATYNICRYMGRPAFYAKGREILAYLLYPQFHKRIHSYASETLEKIMHLRM